METNQNTIMTPDLIARETHSSLRFIYRQLRAGAFPGAFRLGGKWLLSRRNFERWADNQIDCQPTGK